MTNKYEIMLNLINNQGTANRETDEIGKRETDNSKW